MKDLFFRRQHALFGGLNNLESILDSEGSIGLIVVKLGLIHLV
jgi:hypothetical protein